MRGTAGVLFLGVGASMDAGIPDAIVITRRVVDFVESNPRYMSAGVSGLCNS